MTNLANHQSAEFTRILLCGDSGSGKTGALAALAEAGYKLRILDLDNGMDILKNLLAGKPEAIANVDFITLTEKFVDQNGKPVAKNTKVWADMMGYLNEWSNEGSKIMVKGEDGKPTFIPIPEDQVFNLGKPQEWGPDSVLVIDSSSAVNRAAMRYILKLNARPAGPTYESDWYEAQNLVEAWLAMLTGDDFKTNVIIISHIDYKESGGKQVAYPSGLGKALGPKIGQYFNSVLEVKKTGVGTAAKRTIHTNPQGLLDVKNPNPHKVAASYPAATGLVDYFKAVRQPV